MAVKKGYKIARVCGCVGGSKERYKIARAVRMPTAVADTGPVH